MAHEHAKSCRAKRLEDIEIQYPFWVFDVDQPAWPRKVADMLSGSRPAAIIGWVSGSWEYGTDLSPVSRKYLEDEEQAQSSAEQILVRLRYDDRFQPDTFNVVYGNGAGSEGESSKMFGNWVFDQHGEGFVSPRRILRLERRWDGVIFWDSKTRKNLLDEDQRYTAYGVAVEVSNDDEFLKATGVKVDDCGDKISRAEFTLLDGNEETMRGVVYPNRWQQGRGLYINRGPDFLWNKNLLRGTRLQNAAWSEVEEYVLDKRHGPLF